MKKIIDLSDLKAGDKVWNIHKGEVKILEIENDEFYPLLVGSSKHTYYRFKLNGLYHTDDQHPTLFHSEQEFREYWGMESNQLTKREQFAMAAMQGLLACILFGMLALLTLRAKQLSNTPTH
jgi:hypothetical protein